MAKKAERKPDPAPAVSGDPTTAAGWIQLAEKAVTQANILKARDCYNAAIKLEPKNLQAWFKKGLLLEDMGINPPGIMAREDLFKDAIHCFEQVITIEPQNVAAFLHVGQVYVRLADYARNLSEADNYAKQALVPLDKALQLDPKQSKAWYARGYAHLRLKQDQDALQDFIKTTENDNQNTEAWWNLGCMHDLLGNYQAAFDAFQRVLTRKPSDTELDTRLQKLRIRLHATTRTPGITAQETEALNQLDTGQRLVKQDNFPKALQFLMNALQTFNAINNPYGELEALRYIALSHKALRQWEVALAILKQFHALAKQLGDTSKIAEAAHNMGYIAFKLGFLEGAIATFTESVTFYRQLKDDPKLSDGLSNLGKAYQKQGDFPRAIEAFTECLMVDTNRKEVYHQGGDLVELGDTHKLMGDLGQAKENYNKAIAIYKQLDYSWKVEEVTRKIKDLGEKKPPSLKQGKKT